MTACRAAQWAGGANERGSLRRVNVIRDGWEKQIDLTTAAGLKFKVQAGDIVEVRLKDVEGSRQSDVPAPRPAIILATPPPPFH